MSDPGKGVAGAYGVVTPDREYPYRWTFYIGLDGRILHIDKQVNPTTHGADVATELAQLGVAKRK